MKIVACVRALNEEHIIARFCLSYDWADLILVADGGSADGTVDTALDFANVRVEEFTEWIQLPSGMRHQPENRHLNFLFDWAVAEGADWIILDDLDGIPNPALRRDARAILEMADKPAVYAYRLSLWGNDQYFPKKSLGLGAEGRSLWAWQPKQVSIYGDEEKYMHFQPISLPGPHERLNLDAPPYCLLHYEYPDEATVERKLKRNEGFGLPRVHPLDSIYAPPVPLPEWVYA